MGVAVLRNARVASPQGWVIGEHDTFLPDHCINSVQPHRSLIYRSVRLRPDRRIRGRTLLLASDYAEVNFCHLIADALPRTHLFEASKVCSWDDVDHIIIHNFATPGRQQLMELAGLPQEKLIHITDFHVAECETLIAPTFPGLDRSQPAWVADYWRSKLPPPRTNRRRIYVSRKRGSRGLVNEEEILSVARDFDFEELDPGNGCQHQAFQEAEIVLGLHGAALAHVVFCRPKSVLIELMSPVYISAHYYTASVAAGMDYYSILGSLPADGRGTASNWVPSWDYTISPDLLRGLLREVTGELH